MLIRWAACEDKPAWRSLDPSIAEDEMDRRIAQYEAAMAIDRRTNACLGLLVFDRTSKEITFERTDTPAASERLRLVAQRQFEPCSGSFHCRYPDFIRRAQEAFCPVCNDEPMPPGQSDIAMLEYSWACGEYPGQGRLFGKMYVMPRRHAFQFEDMQDEEMIGFMREVQRVGAALRKVTGAVKINYEMHSNSGAHLHMHLFPRYLDDDFPGISIDYHQNEPAPYEDYDEYLWFIEQMRKELNA